jgi:hypothetical protein
MAYKKIGFTRQGFRETVADGDSLYILAPFGEKEVWPVVVCALPQGAASVNIFSTFVPLNLLQANITDASFTWHPWVIGTITSASVKKYDAWLDYFTCIRVDVSGGSAIIEGGK